MREGSSDGRMPRARPARGASSTILAFAGACLLLGCAGARTGKKEGNGAAAGNGGAAAGAGGVGGGPPSGGGATGAATDASVPDAVEADAPPDAGEVGALDAAADGDAGNSADAPDVGVTTACPAGTDLGPSVPSSSCSIAPLAIDAAAVCGAGNPCPIDGARRIVCDDSGYGPWLAASGSSGASILFDSGRAPAGSVGTVSHLFTLAADPAADRVDDVPGVTSAVSALSIESSGARAIFSGEMPGAWLVRETADRWTSEETTDLPQINLAMISDGRSIDDAHAFTAYVDLGDSFPRLGARQGACWQSRVLAPEPADSMAMDVDALGSPWVAWRPTGAPALRLAAPDGTIATPFSGTAVFDIYPGFWSPPIVLAGGLTATDATPALAAQGEAGIHVLTLDATAAMWNDHVVPGSAPAIVTTDCPPQFSSSEIGTVPCDGLRTCALHEPPGALGGFGLARTRSGRAYVAWLESQLEVAYALEGKRSDNCLYAQECECVRTVVSAAARVNLVIAHVTGTPTPPEAIRRFQLLSTDVVPVSLPFLRSMVMTARGDTLLVIATLNTTPHADLRYLEIDTTKLP